MRASKLITKLIIGLSICNASYALAETSYYRWQDNQGAWHFSDQAPHTQTNKTTLLKVPETNVNTASSSIKPVRSNSKPFIKKPSHVQQQKIAQQRKQHSKQNKLCQKLKAKLYTLHKKLRTGYKEPTGNKLRAQRRNLNEKIYHQC